MTALRPRGSLEGLGLGAVVVLALAVGSLSLQGDVMADRVPRCPVCTGVIKPDIVFFGEELPQRFLLHLADFPMADLLFVIGTSLEVCGPGGHERPGGSLEEKGLEEKARSRVMEVEFEVAGEKGGACTQDPLETPCAL